MGKLVYAKSFRDLVVYQKARELAQEIFEITAAFPNWIETAADCGYLTEQQAASLMQR